MYVSQPTTGGYKAYNGRKLIVLPCLWANVSNPV